MREMEGRERERERERGRGRERERERERETEREGERERGRGRGRERCGQAIDYLFSIYDRFFREAFGIAAEDFLVSQLCNCDITVLHRARAQ